MRARSKEGGYSFLEKAVRDLSRKVVENERAASLFPNERVVELVTGFEDLLSSGRVPCWV